MYCNHAFYFGATPDNGKELSELKGLNGCCGVNVCGSSTGTLLVHKEEDNKSYSKYVQK